MMINVNNNYSSWMIENLEILIPNEINQQDRNMIDDKEALELLPLKYSCLT